MYYAEYVATAEDEIVVEKVGTDGLKLTTKANVINETSIPITVNGRTVTATMDSAVPAVGSSSSSLVPLWRLYNPYAEAGTHLLTTDAAEYSALPAYGWRPEGALFYGLG